MHTICTQLGGSLEADKSNIPTIKVADAPTGYIFYFGGKGWLVTDDLLNGVCGVGLGLLSAVDMDNMDWDEAMMLS